MMEKRVTEIMDSGDTVYLVFFGFSKAFEFVTHHFLIQKRKGYGINNSIVNCIESFLHERTLNVLIKGLARTTGLAQTLAGGMACLA